MHEIAADLKQNGCSQVEEYLNIKCMYISNYPVVFIFQVYHKTQRTGQVLTQPYSHLTVEREKERVRVFFTHL